MIQDIHPHSFDNQFIAEVNICDNDFIFHFKGDELLLVKSDEVFLFPRKSDLKECNDKGVFLFMLNGVRCFLVNDCVVSSELSHVYHDVKLLRNTLQKDIDWAGNVAMQLKVWYEQNRFCGKCGSQTQHKENERALFCPVCNAVYYPTISPAIIVAVLSNDKILLASGANFRRGYFSLVAGYVEVGESIEDAVVREVKEEIGIDVWDVSYYKSQPWPNSGSMLIGFTAKADDKQPIRVDGIEIVEAAWFTRDNLPNYPPERSIAGEMIDSFKVKGEI